MRRTVILSLLCSALASASLAAQATRTVSPGMNRQQVVAALGKPLRLSEADGYTYIFYANQCARACGMNDLVVLHADSVVDAIFRSPDRHYTGKSSSPEMIPARVARKASTPSSKPLMRPGKPNDVKPSIPVNPPKLKPAP
jgi:hypothetical protein